MTLQQRIESAMRDSLEELDGVFTYIAVTDDALGVAKDEMAAKPLVLYESDDVVALALFGGEVTSSGDFHNALNFAGVFKAPCVFLCRGEGAAAKAGLAPGDRIRALDGQPVEYWDEIARLVRDGQGKSFDLTITGPTGAERRLTIAPTRVMMCMLAVA